MVLGKKQIEVPLPQLNDIDVDADENLLTIDAATTKKPIVGSVDDPIYTAALLELAAGLDQRPKGCAQSGAPASTPAGSQASRLRSGRLRDAADPSAGPAS